MNAPGQGKSARRVLGAVIRYVIPLVVSAGLCYILYAGVDLSAIMDGVRTCHYGWMAGWLALNLLVIYCRSVRWRLQLRAIGVNPPMWAMVCSFCGTYAVNLVFPRLGEVWRSGYVARRQGAGFTEVFGSMVADRLSDTVCVLLITLGAALGAGQAMARFGSESDLPAKVSALMSSPWVLVAAAVALAGVMVVLLMPRLPLVARVRALAGQVWTGFISIGRMRSKWLWLLCTAGIWGGYFVSTVCTFMAFAPTAGVMHAYGLHVVLVTYVFGSLAMAVPSNGGIGPWQVAVMMALCGIYGMDRGPALTYATLVLGFQTLTSVVLGLMAFAAIALDRRKVAARG